MGVWPQQTFDPNMTERTKKLSVREFIGGFSFVDLQPMAAGQLADPPVGCSIVMVGQPQHEELGDARHVNVPGRAEAGQHRPGLRGEDEPQAGKKGKE